MAIESAKRGKRQNSLTELVPILDSSVSSKTSTEVNTYRVTVLWLLGAAPLAEGLNAGHLVIFIQSQIIIY